MQLLPETFLFRSQVRSACGWTQMLSTLLPLDSIDMILNVLAPSLLTNILNNVVFYFQAIG